MSKIYFAFNPEFIKARRLEVVANKDGRLQRVWKGTKKLAMGALNHLEGRSKLSNAVILGGTLIGASASVMAARNTMSDTSPKTKTVVIVRRTTN